MRTPGVHSLSRTLSGFLCVLYLPFSVSAATPPDAAPVILIQNATVLTVSHGTIEHGSILTAVRLKLEQNQLVSVSP